MTKNIIIILILLLFIYSLSTVYAMGPIDNRDNNNYKKSKFKSSSTLNWVHPNLRESYKGYTKLKLQKQLSPMWQHTTNRPSGNIKGGGTTKYEDYTPFYNPSQKARKKE
ncbi:MAG: hypothetical protein KAI40_05025 [Desulfobacterales bacterium]|nr:hypothetical protein [Desulfobacterales bacterium]